MGVCNLSIWNPACQNTCAASFQLGNWSQNVLSLLIRIFLLQAIGGSVWHGIKGFRNSPYGERRIGALTAIKARAPVLGGNFGVWGGLFSTFDCAVKHIRKKEDPYNASM